MNMSERSCDLILCLRENKEHVFGSNCPFKLEASIYSEFSCFYIQLLRVVLRL